MTNRLNGQELPSEQDARRDHLLNLIEDYAAAKSVVTDRNSPAHGREGILAPVCEKVGAYVRSVVLLKHSEHTEMTERMTAMGHKIDELKEHIEDLNKQQAE